MAVADRAPRADAGATASDAAVFDELVALAGEDDGRWLTQFRSVAGAHQYRYLYRELRAIAGAGARVLDWGVATGHFSYFLVRAGYRAVGYSIENLAFAPLRHHPHYAFARGGPGQPVALPFRADAFDVVVSVGVLEHVHETGGNDLDSLREIARVLRPGGAFLCYHLPNQGSWVEFMARRLPAKPHHSRLYGRSQVEELVSSAGLQVERLRQYAFLPRNMWGRLPASLRRSRAAALGWDALDAAMERLVPPLCTYFTFVARKPAGRQRPPRG